MLKHRDICWVCGSVITLGRTTWEGHTGPIKLHDNCVRVLRDRLTEHIRKHGDATTAYRAERKKTRDTESGKLIGIKIAGQSGPVLLVEPKPGSFSDCYDGRHAECPAVYEGAGLIIAACSCHCHGFGQDSPLYGADHFASAGKMVTETNPHLRTDADVWKYAKISADSSTSLYRNLRREGWDD